MQRLFKGLFESMIGLSNKKEKKLGASFENRKNNSLKGQNEAQLGDVERVKEGIDIIKKQIEALTGNIVEKKKEMNILSNKERTQEQQGALNSLEVEIKKLGTERSRKLGSLQIGENLIKPRLVGMEVFDMFEANMRKNRKAKENVENNILYSAAYVWRANGDFEQIGIGVVNKEAAVAWSEGSKSWLKGLAAYAIEESDRQNADSVAYGRDGKEHGGKDSYPGRG